MDPVTIAGLVGVSITVVAFGYSLYEAYQANKHAKRAEFLIELILKAMQNEGLADLNQDKEGRITGLNFRLIAKGAELTLAGHPATVTVTKNDDEGAS